MSARADALKEQAARALLWWASRPRRIRALVARRRLPQAPPARGARVVAAAVQMELTLVRTPEAFVVQVAELTAEAVDRGAQLVVFPEDCGSALLGMLPPVADASGRDVDALVHILAGPRARVADVLAFVGPYVERALTATFSEVARRTGAYVVAGSAMLPVGGGVRNVAFLFGPDGRLVGRHAKCHLIDLEERWGLQTGDDLEVYETSLGRLAMAVCMDSTYFETFRILALQGAEIVCIPTADPQPYNFWKARRGPWPRTQESPVYSVHACLVGRVLGLELTGRSSLFAPLELTPDGSGVIAQAATADAQEVVVGELDLAALRRLRAERPLRDVLRPDLYRRVFPAAYREYRARHPHGRRVWADRAGAPAVRAPDAR